MPSVETVNIRGPVGPDGAPGKDGTDASVTAANIASALGYTPADAEKVNQLSEEMADQFADRYTKAETDAAISDAIDEGEYVLVETITVTEENTTTIARTEEPDGTPYDFQAAIMQITFEAAAATAYFRADVNDSGLLNMTMFSAIGTSKRYLYIRAFRENGYLFMEGSAPSTSPHTATTSTFPGAQRFWEKSTGIR